MTKNCTFATITKKLCFIQSKPANYRHLLNTDTSLLLFLRTKKLKYFLLSLYLHQTLKETS